MKILHILTLIVLLSITAFSQSNPAVAAAAENFSARSNEGASFELSKLKGKVVLLTFWSTKCPICRAEIPSLNQLADQFKGGDVVFAAPTANDGAMVKRFTENNPFSFIILPDSLDAVIKYSEKDGDGNLRMGFPAHFLIDRDGRIGLITNGAGKTGTLASEISRMLAKTDDAEAGVH